MRAAISTIAACAVLCGCTMVSSNSVKIRPLGESAYQRAGTYYLAKQVLQISFAVTTTTNGANSTTDKSVATSVVTVPDEKYPMQTGFELSPFSDDNIEVDYENGLLKQISATAVDRTSDIAIALAQDAALLREAPVVTTNTKIFQFDPYNEDQAKNVNKALATFNLCVEVETYAGHWTPGCKNGSWAGTTAPAVQQVESYKIDEVIKAPGVYYRRAMPRMVHSVLDGNTVESRQLMFANNGPIYKVDIDRTAFVTRETKVSFTSGELTSVSVKKDSEALAIAKLPVAIVGAYVGGIVDAFTQRAGVQKARENYLNSYSSALNAEVALIKAQNAAGAARTTAGAAGAGSNGLLSTAAAPGTGPWDRRSSDCPLAHPINRDLCE